MASSSGRAAAASSDPALQNHRLGLFALAIGLVALFAHLGGYPLISPDEGRNAEVAREMMESGAWLVPTYNGATYLDKPAFFFRAVALSLSFFGTNEWAARLPSALSGFGLLLLVYGFCRRVYDGRSAALAVIVVATTPLVIAFSRIVIFDMMLGFFVSAAIFAAYLAEESEGPERSRWYLAAAAAAGLATLVKGPVGFLVPLLVMAAFHGSLRRTDAIQRFFRPAHWLVFLALVLPWFVGLSLACPDFPYYGIMKESLARFATTEFRRTQPFYYYGLIIAGLFLPWSLMLPESIAAAWRRRAELSRPDRLFVVWALVVVAFFSLSQSKLPGYILTGVVALGVLTARVFAAALADPRGPAAGIVRRAMLGLLAFTLLAAAAATGIVLWPEAFLPRLSHPERWLPIAPTLPALGASLALLAGAAALAVRSRDLRIAFAAFASVPLVLLNLNIGLVGAFAASRSGKHVAESLAAHLPAEVELACLTCLPHGAPFYLGRKVTVVSDSGKEFTSNYVLYRLASGGPKPERFVPIESIDSWIKARKLPIFLMAQKEQWPLLEGKAGELGLPVIQVDPDIRAIIIPTRQQRSP